MAISDPQAWVHKLGLQPHVEGGWYGEVYRSPVVIDNLPGDFEGPRNLATHIYFLLTRGNFSAFHRIKSDELWHFYAGDPLVIYEISEDRSLKAHIISADEPFTFIRAGSWFASRVHEQGNYSLVGCSVSPGFDFKDFELAKADQLVKDYPEYETLIRELCRQ